MTTAEAKQVVKGFIPDCSKDEIRKAWQHLVDSGEVWQMDTWHIQMAECLISSGVVERNAA